MEDTDAGHNYIFYKSIANSIFSELDLDLSSHSDSYSYLNSSLNLNLNCNL